MHPPPSMYRWVLAFWKEMLAEARVERRFLSRALARWSGSAAAIAWSTWLSYLGERAHYLRCAARIAATFSTCEPWPPGLTAARVSRCDPR